MNGFAKYIGIGVAVAIPLIAAVFVYGELHARVSNVEAGLVAHSDKAAHDKAVDTLARMEEKLKEIPMMRQKIEEIWRDVIYMRRQSETQ